MRVLIDTHVWLWMQAAPDRLADDVADLLAARDTDRLLSVASVWEMVIKHALGRLALPRPPRRYVPERLETSVTAPLAATLQHVLEVATLPAHHRDPFDRLLVAQARVEGVPLVTADDALEAYEVELVRAT